MPPEDRISLHHSVALFPLDQTESFLLENTLLVVPAVIENVWPYLPRVHHRSRLPQLPPINCAFPSFHPLVAPSQAFSVRSCLPYPDIVGRACFSTVGRSCLPDWNRSSRTFFSARDDSTFLRSLPLQLRLPHKPISSVAPSATSISQSCLPWIIALDRSFLFLTTQIAPA